MSSYLETIEKIKNKPGYKAPIAFGVGLKRSKKNITLDVLFPCIKYQCDHDTAALLSDICLISHGQNSYGSLNYEQMNQIVELLQTQGNTLEDSFHLTMFQNFLASGYPQNAYSQLEVIVYFLFEGSQAVETPEEAYFKLQMISQRHVRPHGVNTNSAFKVLQNLAWSNKGPILLEDLEAERLKGYFSGQPLLVSHIDKFPYLVNYHHPEGSRIAAGSQVRLGAYLGEGTTVMPAGYINFNAGTEGNAMVEGRISAGVFVKQNSDIGGGASIMGTLSGGNEHVISIGEECLLGANAGAGISLGFGCTIAAGLYIYGGMKISLYDEKNQPINIVGEEVPEGQNIVKASELSGRNYMLFIQDSTTGKVICKPNQKTINLNPDLHSHN